VEVHRVDETRRFELHVPPRPALVGAGADDHVLACGELENMRSEALARLAHLGSRRRSESRGTRRRMPKRLPLAQKSPSARGLGYPLGEGLIVGYAGFGHHHREA